MGCSVTEADGVDAVETVDAVNTVDGGSGNTGRDEDAAGGRQRAHRPHDAAAAADNMRDEEASADAEGAQDTAAASAALESDELHDSADSQGEDSNSGNGESDSDCGSESSYLEAMTSSGQQHYLRLGDTPRRRSALRLSRIIARRQLLWKLSQGRDGGAGMSWLGMSAGVDVKIYHKKMNGQRQEEKLRIFLKLLAVFCVQTCCFAKREIRCE